MANEFKIKNGLIVDSGSTQISGSVNIQTGQNYTITADTFIGSLNGNANTATTASYANTATTASYANTATTASYIAYASSFPFTGSAKITGSLNIVGPVTVTGSILVTGSLNISQNVSASSFTGSLFGTASYSTQAL